MGPENPKELESKSETEQETREAIMTHGNLYVSWDSSLRGSTHQQEEMSKVISWLNLVLKKGT